MRPMLRLSKHLASRVITTTAFARLVSLLERADDPRPNLLRVLTYHRVDDPQAHPERYPGLISATPRDFEQQMSFLAAHYHVVSMQDLLDVFQKGVVLPPRAVLITFDDAYDDFATHAWPTLKRYHLPVTLFVPTAFPDHPERVFWWDRLHEALSSASECTSVDTPLGSLPAGTAVQRKQTYRRLRDYLKGLPHAAAMASIKQICDDLGVTGSRQAVLGWAALRQLASEGVTMGAHTRTHPLLHRVSPDDVRAEVVGSLEDLRHEMGAILPIFAYPSGGFDEQVVQVLKQEGISLACTTIRGMNNLRRVDPLRLRRINIGSRTNFALFRARLLPWSTVFDRRLPPASS